MARPRKTAFERIETEIEEASAAVIKAKKNYDLKARHLADLIDKKKALEREKLVDAILKSKRSYDEILAFISSEPGDEEL